MYLIGEVPVPAMFVSDPQYGDRVTQVQSNPYYVLRRLQFWDRSQDNYRGYYVDSGGTAINEQFTIKTGVSDTVSQSVENTVGFKLTETGTLGFKLTATGSEVSGSASISNEISQSLKVTTTNTYVSTTEVDTQETVQIAAGTRTVRARWCVVDRYEIHRASDQSLLNFWEVPLANTQVYDSRSA